MEDITRPERVEENEKCDRRICVFAYVRGTHLKQGLVVVNKRSYESSFQQISGSRVHMPGCGDLQIEGISLMASAP